MARLGRGQPFRPLVRPAINEAADSVVFAGPAPANVTVTAYFGAVSVTTAGTTPPNVAVAAFEGTPSVTTAGTTPPNVAVAGHFGSAFAGVNFIGATANVSVQAYFGAVSVTTPGPEVLYVANFDDDSTDGWNKFDNNSSGADTTISASNVWSASGNYSLLLQTNGSASGPVADHGQAVTVGVPIALTGVLYSPQGCSVNISVDWYNGGTYLSSSTASSFTLPAGTPGTYSGQMVPPATANQSHLKFGINGTPAATVQLFIDNPTVTQAPNIQVAALLGTPGTNVNGVTPPNTLVVAPGPNLVSNPFGAGGLSTGWSGFNGTMSATTSPPSGCPFGSALKYVNNGTTAGAMEGPGSWAVLPSTQYTASAWVYSSVSPVQIGFDWQSNTHAYLSTSVGTVTVPVNTWVFVTVAVTSNASAAFAYARIGTSTLGETVYATEVYAYQPGLPGVASVTLPGPTVNVAVAANFGAANVSTTVGPAPETAQAYLGTVSVSTPGPAPANVVAQAFFGNAVFIPNTVFAGPVANVTVAAPFGHPSGSFPGPVAANVTVSAHFGAVTVSTTLGPAQVVAQAPLGAPGASVVGQTARATVAAPMGAANTSATAPSVNVSVAAPTGTVSITVAGQLARVNVQAPAGGAGGGASISPAQVEVTAPAGAASVSTTFGPASCGVASHLGTVGTSVAGQTAGIIVLAPVSPLVAALYPKSATAIMEFYAGAVKTRKVWFGYGDVQTMNTNVPNPGET